MSRQPLRIWWLGASALALCIGSAGPWGTVLGAAFYGLTDGGFWTFIAGTAALFALVLYVRSEDRPGREWLFVLIFFLAFAATAVSVYVWVHRQEFWANRPPGTSIKVQVGWGLVLATLAGFSLCMSAIIAWIRERQEPSAPPPVPAVPSAQDPHG